MLKPFNLKDEREGGHFDSNLNYVWKKETGEVDSWVAGMDEATMERAIGEAAAALKVSLLLSLFNIILVAQTSPARRTRC